MLKPDIKEVTDFDVDEKFSSYLDFIEFVFCPRGWYESIDDKKNWHHSGGFSFLLNKGKKISREEFLSWKNDIEHGFFHGFLVGFWIFCQSRNDLIKHLEKDKQRQKDRLNFHVVRPIYSAFFHDFLKCLGQKENHDKDLFHVFPDCLPETYVHENPVESMKNSLLVSSDRIELNRFPDASEWIDNSKMGSYHFKKNLFVRRFYDSYRKVLERLYVNRDSLWLSHVSEEFFEPKFIGLKHQKFYPEFHWVSQDGFGIDEENKSLYYSVYCDYLPLDGCHRHVLKIINDKQSLTYGLIEKSRIEANDCSVLVSDRDHAVVCKNKDVLNKEWIFLYRNKKVDLKQIDAQNNSVISVNNVNNFFNVMRLIFGKIEAHKVA